MDMSPPIARPSPTRSPPLSYQSLEGTFKSEPISNYDRNVQEFQQLFGTNVSNIENREQEDSAFNAQSNAPNPAPNNAHVMNELMEEEGNDSDDDIVFEEIYFPQTFPRPLPSNSDALTKREDDTISGNKPFNITVIQPRFFHFIFIFVERKKNYRKH